MFKFNFRMESSLKIAKKGLGSLLAIFSLLSFHSQSFADWQPPQYVSDTSATVEDTSPPVLSVNNLGNALTVYVQEGEVDSYRPVFANFYAEGSGWTNLIEISSNEQVLIGESNEDRYIGQADPDVQLNSSNYGVAVWEAEEWDEVEAAYLDGIYAAARDSNGVWQPQKRISNLATSITEVIKSPEIALNESGVALAVWRQEETTGNIYASFLPPGGIWTAPVAISASYFPVDDDLSYIDVSIDANGNAVVAYLGEDALGAIQVNALYYNSSTITWSSTTILDQGLVSASLPTTAIDDNGNAFVIWERTLGGLTGVRTAYFQGNSWQTSQTLDANVSPEATPFVVLDPAGNATAIWETLGVIYSSTRLVGETVWNSPIAISEGVGNSLQSEQVQRALAVDSGGNVIAIWQDYLGNVISAFKIFGYDWQDPKIIYSPGSGETLSELEIGLAECGLAVALWRNDSISLEDQAQTSVIFNLLTPEELEVTRCIDHFGVQSRYLDILTWDPLPEECILFYKIYKDGVLIGKVFSDEKLRFVNPLECNPETAVYTVTSVNIYNHESHPATVTAS